MTEKERWGEERDEEGREIEAKRTRMHCVGLCCPEGGVLTSFLFSFLFFFLFSLSFLFLSFSCISRGPRRP